jgi:hypothetical protein
VGCGRLLIGYFHLIMLDESLGVMNVSIAIHEMEGRGPWL